jgi:hypothetical protein
VGELAELGLMVAKELAVRLRETEDAATLARDPIRARKKRVSNLLHRLLWNESEGDSEEFEILRDDLSARLDEADRNADFETLPIETLARRVISDMGLSGELTLSVCEGAGSATPELRSSA